MTSNPLLPALVAAFATILAAMIAAFVAGRSSGAARSQAETARHKLRLDLYDRRFAIWSEVVASEEAGRKLIIERGKLEYMEFGPLFEPLETGLSRAASASAFLFSLDIAQKVSGIRAALMDVYFAVHDLHTSEGVSPEEREPMRKAAMESIKDSRLALRDFEFTVHPYLDFNNINFGTLEVQPATAIQNFWKGIPANWRTLTDGKRWKA